MAKKITPENEILQITSLGTIKYQSDKISFIDIGHKAVGLAALPKTWTLPFVSVSSDLYHLYRSDLNNRSLLIADWACRIISVLQSLGFVDADDIIVRSSACTEELDKRGRFYSTTGKMTALAEVIGDCLMQIYRDKGVRSEKIPLIVQKYCIPKMKGHLSNERRCYEEFRDWLGEFESAMPERSSRFQINIRKWRHNLGLSFGSPLPCILSPLVSEVLKIPAKWATQKHARVHFEWVWDGRYIYVVQADEELGRNGHNPIKEHKLRKYNCIEFTPKCLRKIEIQDGEQFKKIANSCLYKKLGLPTAPLYILNNKIAINLLSKDAIDSELKYDLAQLVKGSLIIRSDLATKDLAIRQLLPRTEEVRSLHKAITWLREQSKRLSGTVDECVFIFHNFIPAQSAAFTYAHPNDPLVQIESLWGLPEGLYYNSHDQYLVDTGNSDINAVTTKDAEKFRVREKRGFKRVFVSTTSSGNWETLQIAPPYDWKGSLQESDCQYIAHQSRRIANEEGKAVSIMWFVGVPATITNLPAIPWYHEEYDAASGKPSLATKTKSIFDKYFVIQSTRDVETLNQMSKKSAYLTRIKIQPNDEKLLRDKDTLKKIGEIAKSIDAILVLEGAVLSHAYYQLLSTGANVEVLNPFIGFDERHTFNKLVRDKVPEIIKARGETVKVIKLESEVFVKALREKLVEEAYETLDAKDLESIKAEIIDIREVLDTLVKRLQIPETELKHEQEQKRLSRGGFDKGVVLVETHSSPPTHKSLDQDQLLLTGLQIDNTFASSMEEVGVARGNMPTAKWTDRRVSDKKIETKVRIVIPVVKKVWSSKTNDEEIGSTKQSSVVSGTLKGDRAGTNWNIELSISIEAKEPDLL